MKKYNLEINKFFVSKYGIPAELLLFIGENSKSNFELFINNDAGINEIIETAIKRIIAYYELKNITISNCKLNYAENLKLREGSGLFFSDNLDEKKILNNKNLVAFIFYYEKLFGELPYFLDSTKNIDKYLYINDTILKLSEDAMQSH